jgi:predicted aconitase with swiveling domain
LDWESGKTDPVDLKSLPQAPIANSRFNPLPSHLKDAKWWNSRSAQFEEWIYETQTAIVYVHKKLGIVSEAQESLDHFKERCRQMMNQSASSGNAAFDNKRMNLQGKIDAQTAKVNQYQSDVTHYTLDEGGRVLGTVINIFTRGRTTGASASIAANRRRADAQTKLDQAKAVLASLQQQMAALQGESLPGQNQSQIDIQEIKIAPSKRDIVLKAFGLAWIIN